MNPCLDAALRYAALGWHVHPCLGKEAVVKEWQKKASTDPAQIGEWWKQWPRANVAIATGVISGLYVIDEDAGGAETIAALSLPLTLAVESGNGGKHFYFNRASMGPLRFGNTDKKLGPGVDTRGDGGYIIAPPSVHPLTGKKYKWADGLDEPADMPAAIVQALAPKVSIPRPKPERIDGDTTHYGQAALDAECDKVRRAEEGTRNHALNVAAFSLAQLVGGGVLSESVVRGELAHAALGAGLEQREIEKTIESGFKAGVQQPRYPPKREAPFISLDEPTASTTPGGAPAPTSDFPEELLHPPGLLGKISAWMDECAPRETRLLSLAASISTLATVIGRNYATSSGLRANLQVLGVCATGVGKDNGRKCAESLLQAAKLGSRIGGEEFTSAASVYNMLQANPVTLCLVDEYGVILRTQNASKVGAESLVSNAIVKAATASTLHGIQYTEKDRKPIYQPHLVVYGTTTPPDFLRALSSSSVDGGFLGRMIVFHVDHGMKERRWDCLLPEAPADLVAALVELASGSHIPGDRGDMMTAIDLSSAAKPSYQVVCDEDAEAMRRNLDAVCVARANADAKFGGLWARLTAKAEQLALVVAMGDVQEFPLIQGKHMAWGRDVAVWTTERLITLLSDGMSESQAQSDAQFVLACIRRLPALASQSALTKATQKLGARRRKDAIQELKEAGLITEARVASASGPPTTVYLLVS